MLNYGNWICSCGLKGVLLLIQQASSILDERRNVLSTTRASPLALIQPTYLKVTWMIEND